MHADLTRIIIGCFYKVYNELGYGFLEQVYEKALEHELRKQGLSTQRQVPISVYYDNIVVGEYFADILVEDKVILELKATDGISRLHEAQLMNYLKATNMRVGLLLNFGREATYRRRIL